VKKLGAIGKVVPTPTALPDPGDVKLKIGKQDKYKWPHVDKNADIRTGKDTCFGKSSCSPIQSISGRSANR
jgi:hypothetical protein